MSQMAGMAGGGTSTRPQKATSGVAVLLLALAVALGVAVLHELDATPAPMGSTDSAGSQAAAAQPAPPALPPAAAQTRTPAEVKVLVANGTPVNGAASRISTRLQPIGYQLVKPGNTTATAASSSVQYTPGYQAEAQSLATSLGFPASAVQPLANPAPVADLQGSNVVVIVGTQGQPQAQGAAQSNPQGASQGSEGPLSSSRSGAQQQPQR